MWYLYVGLITVVLVDLYTHLRQVNDAKFKNNRERLGMFFLWPLFFCSLIYNLIRIYKEIKKNRKN